MRAFKSAAVGIVPAIALGALAYATGPLFDRPFVVYFGPGAVFLPLFSLLIPSKLVDWLDPTGGPALAPLLLVLGSTCFWAVLFGTAYFASISLKMRQNRR